MLNGEYRHAIDAKKRLFIPAKHREELGEEFIVTKDLREKCLKVYSLAGWEDYIAPIRKLERKVYEKTMRLLHANAINVTPDAQGRVVLTPALLEYAGIEKNAVIVGCGDWAEIWAEEVYHAVDEDLDAAEVLAALESCGL
jgi:MraZ protein